MKSTILFRILFVAAFVSLTASAGAQYASIPDSSFRQALIRLGYATCFDNTQTMIDTTCVSVLAADSLDVGVSDIFDLSGVRYFKHLKYLNCYHNPFTFLPQLPDSLTTLVCYDGLLTTVPAFPGTMRYINLGDNSLTNLPNLPDSLISLSCETNLLSQLPALPSTLSYLSCNSNTILSLPALPASLSYLDCGENALTSLPPLPASLGTLFCQINSLDSLPALPAALTRLYCNNNSLRSLPVLPTGLERLYCFGNNLTTLPALPRSLTWIDCSYNQISTLPTLPDSLHSFACRVNMSLYCLPQLNKIIYLSFDSTSVSCLPNYPQSNVSSTPALSSLPVCDPLNVNGCRTYTGISDIVSDAISVYPNPTSDMISLVWKENTGTDKKYLLTDIKGREVLSGTMEQPLTSIDMNSLSSGMYLLRIGNTVRKVVKE